MSITPTMLRCRSASGAAISAAFPRFIQNSFVVEHEPRRTLRLVQGGTAPRQAGVGPEIILGVHAFGPVRHACIDAIRAERPALRLVLPALDQDLIQHL